MLKRVFRQTMEHLFPKKQIARKSVPISKHPYIQDVSLGENNCFEGTFRRAIWPVLVIGQMYGVMPVIGVSGRSMSDLHFKWKCIRTFYSLFVLTSLLGYSLFLLCDLFTGTINFGMISNLLFFSMNSLELVSFFGLALNWSKVMQRWQTVETLPVFRNFHYKKSYARSIRFIASTTLLLALTEHLLCVSSSLYSTKRYNPGTNMYTEIVNGFVPCFTSSEHCMSTLISIFIAFINECATFVWNFLDVFIMMIGIGLSTHFKLLNSELKKATIESHSLDFWIKIRTQHMKMCTLVETVDKKIGHMILLSFLNNLFLICKQLFESLRPHPTYFYMIYFWYSLVFLILRTFAVSILAARIDDESKKPIRILRNVPSNAWNAETKRFFDDVLCKTIGLSGMEFFIVTRKLILSVVGTIVTYELVLMQFNKD